MGKFSELAYESELAKDYLQSLARPTDREMSAAEQEAAKIDAWVAFGQPQRLTTEEEYAVLHDDFFSPYWQSGMTKLSTPTEEPPFQINCHGNKKYLKEAKQKRV